MSTANMDPDMLELLSPEERAAIEESEHTPEELEAMKAIAGEGDGEDDDTDEDDEDGDGNGDGQDDGKAKQAAGAEDKSAADKDAGAADDKATDPAATATDQPDNFQPRYQATPPEGYDQKIADLTQESMTLAKQFKDGDIDFDEYNAKVTEINAKRDELNRAKLKSEIAEEMNSQSAEQVWHNTVINFTAQVAKEVDYQKDTAKQEDLDTFVKALAANPANADKSMRWFLDEAHKRVKALHGIGDAKPAGDDKQKEGAKDTAKDRKPPLEAAPKNLSQVPGSDGPGDLAGEFAHMDNLEGMELETALAKMTPEQRDRYARGG